MSSTGSLFYGTAARRGMAADAEVMGRDLPRNTMWAWAFTALGRVHAHPWGELAPEVRTAWKEIVELRGAACKAGTVAAAIWMAKSVMRLACKHGVLSVEELPGALQVQIGVQAVEQETAKPAEDPKAKATEQDEGTAKDKKGGEDAGKGKKGTGSKDKDQQDETKEGEDQKGDNKKGGKTKGRPRPVKRPRKAARVLDMSKLGGSPALKKPATGKDTPGDSEATCEASEADDMMTESGDNGARTDRLRLCCHVATHPTCGPRERCGDCTMRGLAVSDRLLLLGRLVCALECRGVCSRIRQGAADTGPVSGVPGGDHHMQGTRGSGRRRGRPCTAHSPRGRRLHLLRAGGPGACRPG